LFGVDAVLNQQGVWTVEINPRYTASVELLERALDAPLMAWHAAACRDGDLLPAPRATARTCWGKAVLFAQRRVQWTDQLSQQTHATDRSDDQRLLADVPVPGTILEPGHPILTVFETAETMEATRRRLRRRAHAVREVVDA
jgi:predicted ATP-grasp superfamily ATP-dependent carboligase